MSTATQVLPAAYWGTDTWLCLPERGVAVWSEVAPDVTPWLAAAPAAVLMVGGVHAAAR
jgi:hypothetical protein